MRSVLIPSAFLVCVAACTSAQGPAPDARVPELQARVDALAAEVEAVKGKLARTEARQQQGLTVATTPDVVPPLDPARVASGITCDGQRCTIERAFLEELINTPAVLARQARVVPSVKDGKTIGFKFYGIRPGSIPKAIGLDNGDTVAAVNGHKLGSMAAAMNMYAQLRTTDKITVEYQRKGAPGTIEITVR